MHHPLIFLLLAYLSGILLGYYCCPGIEVLIMIIIPLLLAAVVCLTLNRKLCTLIFSLSAFNLLGNLLINSTISPRLPLNHLSHYITDEKVIMEGVLCKAPQNLADRTRYVVLVKKIIERDREIPVRGKLLLTAHHASECLQHGDVVRFSSRPRRPRNFNNPGGFDYERFLAFQGIFVTASLDGKHRIVKVGEDAINPFIRRVERYRTRIRDFYTAELSSPASEIATALITGEKSAMDERMRDQFAVTGVAHILAISGLHIGIIALVSMFLTKTICRCSTRILLATDISKMAALITLVPVVMYCLIAGAGIAAVRATIMVIIYLTAVILNRQDDLWNTLATAAFLILLYSPSSLFDCSFQLSFVSVAAIVYLDPLLSTGLSEHSPDPIHERTPWFAIMARHTGAILRVTLAATLGTAPLIALYFNRCSPWGIPSNLMVVPLIGFLVVPLGLFSSILLLFSRPLAVFAAGIMELLINLSNSIVAFFATMPYADYRITTPTLPEIILYYTGLVMLLNSRRSAWARYGLGLVSVLFIINVCYWYSDANRSSRLRITSLDVGQGEATLVQLPHGKTMLIDGGGFYGSSFDMGSMVVSPLLWKKKIKHIDILVLSHPHPDHLNGLLSVIRNFSIGEVWTNGEESETDTFHAFGQAVEVRGIKHCVLRRGDPPQVLNGVTVQCLHPDQRHENRRLKNHNDGMNNNSLVILLTYRDMAILFTGDIYAEAEARIMASFPRLRCSILKIPHHGSATSSSKAFIEMLKPRFALLSVGRNNSFKLPHPAVIKRYKDAGCTILRTDEAGAVTLETDGSAVWIKTHLQGNQSDESVAGGHTSVPLTYH